MRSSRGSSRPDDRTRGQDDPAARRLALLAADLRASVPAAATPVAPAPSEGAAAATWPDAGPGAPAATRPAEAGDASPTDQGWWADHTRVAARRGSLPEAVPAEDPVESPPALPRPGRHAARRARRVVGPPVPGGLRDWFGPAQLTVVAVVVAVAMGLGAWGLARSQAEVAAPSTGAPGTAAPLVAPPTSTATGATGPSAAASVTVDVTGKVRRPGIVVLDAGARVVDAVEAAGGARPGADLAGLNLARVLLDGEQVVVGEPAGAQPGAVPTVGGSSGSAPTPGVLVNINLATAAELETLPDVGPVTAAAIIAWREQNGGFTSVDQLLDVDGIGEATLATLAPHVTV